ncbi:AAA family ATPase, partial [Rhodomicrobium udaipurense]|uniref:AAA family ATPase n=1 Tax=Rhodomicrobium udaipurense TaxID=1202716 RepID=UPI00308458D5
MARTMVNRPNPLAQGQKCAHLSKYTDRGNRPSAQRFPELGLFGNATPARDWKPRSWVIRDFLERRSVTAVALPWSASMSLSMLAAASVALGRGLASGHDVVAPGPVIVWNGGSDIKMQSERLYEVCCHREWSYRDAGAQMNLLWRGNFELRGPLHPQLMALANAARDRRASAIVLEPLLRLLYRADGGSGDPKAWRVMPMPPCSPSIARQKRR